MRVYKKNFNEDNWEPVNKDELLLALQRWMPQDPISAILGGLALLLTGGGYSVDSVEYRLLPSDQLNVVAMTQQEFDELPNKDPFTMYAIVREVDAS